MGDREGLVEVSWSNVSQAKVFNLKTLDLSVSFSGHSEEMYFEVWS